MSTDQLARIEARLERIERKLEVNDRVEAALEQVDNLVATVGDMVDAWARRHRDLDERIEHLTTLVERATRPATMKRLEGALEQVDQVENLVATAGDMFDAWAAKHRDLDARLENLTRLAERATAPETTQALEAALDQLNQANNLVATVGDIADEWARKVPDLDRRIEGALTVLEQATRPTTLKNLAFALKQVDELPKLAAVAGDALDDIARRAADRGLPVGTLFEDLSNTLEAFIRVAPKIRELLESGMLDAAAIDTLGRVARVTSRLADQQPPQMGFLGALRAMSDPEVQRSVGFAVEFARGFGSTDSPKALPSGNGATR
ncbi:MAG: DUF1641 domain-containing protein [Deltaproteobacteria bacterium]